MDNIKVDQFNWMLLTVIILISLLLYALSILLKMEPLSFFTSVLAIATIALAWENHRLSRDSRKNIEISKNNLMEQHLIKEMENIIKPLYEKRDNFSDLESRYPFINDPYNLWKKIETNKYLANKDVRRDIELYLRTIDEMREKFRLVTDNISEAFRKEKDEIPEYIGDMHRDTIYSGYLQNINSSPTLREKDEQAIKIIDSLKHNSELRKYFIEYIELIKSNNLALMRNDLRNKIINRYMELEEEIDRIEEFLNS